MYERKRRPLARCILGLTAVAAVRLISGCSAEGEGQGKHPEIEGRIRQIKESRDPSPPGVLSKSKSRPRR